MVSITKERAVRCCSKDGTSCESNPCNILTFSKAKEKCDEIGMRLCTEEELASGICCGSGCGFDKKLVWCTKGNIFCSFIKILAQKFLNSWIMKLKSEVTIASLFRQTKQPDIFSLKVKTITKSPGLLSLSNLAIYIRKAELWF
jgi:hypothetical protein